MCDEGDDDDGGDGWRWWLWQPSHEVFDINCVLLQQLCSSATSHQSSMWLWLARRLWYQASFWSVELCCREFSAEDVLKYSVNSSYRINSLLTTGPALTSQPEAMFYDYQLRWLHIETSMSVKGTHMSILQNGASLVWRLRRCISMVCLHPSGPGPCAGRFVWFWASGGAKFAKICDSLPWTPMNRQAKRDTASYILGGEIRVPWPVKTVNDIFTPCLSACVDNNWRWC